MAQYAKIENGAVVMRDNRPQWFDDEGTPVSDERLAQDGWLPIVDERPVAGEFQTVTQHVDIVHADHVEVSYTVVDWAPEEVQAAMRNRVDAERDRRLQLNFTFNGVVYQRDDDAVRRINGAGTLALGAIVGGALPGDYRWHGDDSDFEWIAFDNSVVKMDAQTVMAFGAAAAVVETKLIFAAKAIKAMDPIPADPTDDFYWP